MKILRMLKAWHYGFYPVEENQHCTKKTSLYQSVKFAFNKTATLKIKLIARELKESWTNNHSTCSSFLDKFFFYDNPKCNINVPAWIFD